jgi:hypothetical protein
VGGAQPDAAARVGVLYRGIGKGQKGRSKTRKEQAVEPLAGPFDAAPLPRCRAPSPRAVRGCEGWCAGELRWRRRAARPAPFLSVGLVRSALPLT